MQRGMTEGRRRRGGVSVARSSRVEARALAPRTRSWWRNITEQCVAFSLDATQLGTVEAFIRLNSIRCSFPDGNPAEGNVIKSILAFFHAVSFGMLL